MNNLTTIISEMIENELEGILLDVSNHVLDRLSNKIINEVKNSVSEALFDPENLLLMVEAFDNYTMTIKEIDATPVDELIYRKMHMFSTALAAVAEKIRGK